MNPIIHKRTVSFLFILLTGIAGLAGQQAVTGYVTDGSGNPLAGANVFIKGHFDGAATNTEGYFAFQTSEKGEAVLMATFLGHQPQEMTINLNGEPVSVSFILKPVSGIINDVVISAGLFEAGDRKKSVTLNPLDIVTTPSAVGDIYGALTALPGASAISEDGRLFVRGGDGYESKTYIDGMLSKMPYSSSFPDLPTRGRFSPFLFSGTTFSTGGYSAEYGQALSSALILTSNAFPERTQTELSFLTVGQGITQTYRKDDRSIAAGVNYTNLAPYYNVVSQQFPMNQAPEELNISLVTRERLKNQSVIKGFATFSGSRFGLDYPDLTRPDALNSLSLKNNNGYINLTWTGEAGSGWLLKSGMALTMDDNNLDLQRFKVLEDNRNAQVRFTAKKSIARNARLILGAEETINFFRQNYWEAESGFVNTSQFTDYNTAAFAETEWQPATRIAARVGVRGENSSLLSRQNLALRLSAAYQLTARSQFSLAYGNFYQTPEEDLMRFTSALKFERADHYIINYQYEKNSRVLRLETYLKDYKYLVTYDATQYWNPDVYQNNGSGYSRGIDLFYRDQTTIRNLDFWISYSHLQSKRFYRDYPQKATPHFAPENTLTIVGKYWISRITTQFGLSGTVASGRTYHNPNISGFMNSMTSHYSDLSINCSHLRTILSKPTIIYMSVSNVLGRDNIYGYRYYTQPNEQGVYQRMPVRAQSSRFYLVGVFITI